MNFSVFGIPAALCTFSVLAQAQPATSAKSPLIQTFAPVQLRGYGVLSGELRTLKDSSSVLRVETQNPAKAKLLQAKFISDFSLSPDVKSSELTSGNVKVSYLQVKGQGAVTALRSDKTVYLLTAATPQVLSTLIKTMPLTAQKLSRPETTVPMYLDRWDKFSFRHYYRPWETPVNGPKPYNFVGEFDFAKQQDRAGFVFWADSLNNDTAEGMMNDGWWEWGQKEALKRQLPVGINSMVSTTTWLLNQYRDQTQPKMPGFTGNLRDLMSPFIGGQGDFSWSSTTAKAAQLGIVQDTVRKFASDPNVTTFLEPHGELQHGPQDIFLEYGPVADSGYRRFLQQKYGTLAKLGARWGEVLNSWNDVRVPEISSFVGDGPDALDVSGKWRVGYEELTEPAKHPYYYDRVGGPQSKPAPDEWYQPNFDDSSWPELLAPDNDKQFFLEKRPAIFRRNFEVTADWKQDKPRLWLYIWDLNGATNQEVRIVLNGKEVGQSKIQFFVPHWTAVEVTSAVQPGKNTLALRLPQGHLAYKTYLSAAEPKQYPNLGKALNAKWVDLMDFTQWSRVQGAKEGVEMIRQVVPDHQIVLMAPTNYADGVKELATQYGGEFHDTGFMGAFFADYPSSVMRGVDLPFSLEPGGPAPNLEEWKKMMGYYQMEGVQGIDYFIHIGDILWNPEIKADYEAHRKQISLLGQSHYEKAQVGILYSDRTTQLTGFPWGAAPNTNLAGGYWSWNTGSILRGTFAYDGLTQSSFARGEAKPYRAIVDTNTSIMDESMVSDIEKWVREGGTFITIAQTGRHTPEEPNVWPISRLTGYKVEKIDLLDSDGNVKETGALGAAPAQQVFDQSWNGIRANGLHLQKVAADAQNLLMWDDGSVAAGARRLGKGYIIQLGAKFAGASIMDRVEPGANSVEVQQQRKMLTAILDWRGIKRENGRLASENEQVWVRPAVTNNGLYDTWSLFNWSKDKSQTVSLILGKDKNPSHAIDIKDAKPIAVTPSVEGARINDIVLKPLETRVFLTPRGTIEKAPLAWFDLQRKWWRGTKAPAPKQLPKPSHRFARDLTADWKFQATDSSLDTSTLLSVAYDDTQWKSRSLGIWNTEDTAGKKAGIFRRKFTVPNEWKGGKVSLWMTSWWNTSFVDRGRVWLDGKEVKPLNGDAYVGIGLPSLTPGSTHSISVEVQSDGVLAGLRGQCWISFEPTAEERIPLSGEWAVSRDGLKYDSNVTLPGNYDGGFLRRSFMVDEKYRGKNAVVTVEGDPSLVTILINGNALRRHHHMIGERWSLNLTPFIRWGANNEIEILRWENSGAGNVREVSLGFFDPKYYP